MIKASDLRSIGQVEQVEEEMHVLSALHHPHIVHLREMHFARATSTFTFVMDLASGGTLAEYLSSQARALIRCPRTLPLLPSLFSPITPPAHLLTSSNHDSKVI